MALTTAGFIGIVYSSNPIEESVDYNVGDFNQIAAAKLRADAYENRTPVELNYSSNIRALDMGPQGGEDTADGGESDISWPDSIPSYEKDLKPEYLDAVADHLRTQNQVIWCSTPQIANVDTYESGQSMFEANINNAWIRCRSGNSGGSVPTVATVNISDTLQTNNRINKYLVLAEHSEIFASKARELIKDKPDGFWTADGSGSDCGSLSDAKDDAEEEALNGLPNDNFARNAYAEEEKPSYFQSVELDASYSNSATSSGDKPYGTCGANGQKTDYDADAEAEVDQITLTFRYKDGEHELINKDGSTNNNIEFGFTYQIRP